MSERKRKPRLETQTAQPLQAAPPIEKEDPIQKLLGVLYTLAVEGNVTAAKLYLDYCARQKGEDSSALTPEEAQRILREQSVPPLG